MSNGCVLRRDRKTATEGAEVTCSVVVLGLEQGLALLVFIYVHVQKRTM